MTKKAFTLMELLLVLVGFTILIGIVFGLYQNIFSNKQKLTARQHLIQQSYQAMDMIQKTMQDYHIDYEEYRNRKAVGCNSTGGNRDRDEKGYCSQFTHYGNANSINNFDADISLHRLYACININTGEGCFDESNATPLYYQSFGQYALQFIDTQKGTGYNTPGPAAITGDVQEIYLISPDNTQRLFIRRALVDSGDFNGDTLISGDNELRYTLQILRLRGLDIGSGHTLVPGDATMYDGQIDTWVCDALAGFICHGTGIDGIYSGLYMPSDEHDGWIDIFDENITVSDRKIAIYPSYNPNYNIQDIHYPTINPYIHYPTINPYIQIWIQTKLYAGGLPIVDPADSIWDFDMILQTTHNTNTWYSR